MQTLRYSPYLKSIFAVLDALVLCLCLFYFNKNLSVVREEHVITAVLLVILWFLLSSKTKIYNVPRILTYTSYLERLLLQLLFFVFGAVLISRITKYSALNFSSPYFLGLFSAILFVLKSSIFAGIKFIRLQGYNFRNIMFLSETGASKVLKDILSKRKDYGYRIYDFKGEKTADVLTKFWLKNGIHTVYVPLENKYSSEEMQEIMLAAEKNKVKVSVVPDILTDQFSGYEVSYAEAQPVLEKTKNPLEFSGNFIIKRSFDILFSVGFLVLIGIWLFPLLAIFIKLDSSGPIFFRQKRLGFQDREFFCLKFRTMIKNDGSATKTTAKNDKRITRFGRFLRRSSLDETPQFINVLLGEMSVVGPRPHMLSVDNHYKEFIERYSLRSQARPGITGLAQISGLRGEDENMEIQMQKRILADAFYIKNWSLNLDLIIILKTVFLLLKGDKKAF